MFLQLAITIVFLLSILGIFVWFFKVKNAIASTHQKNILALENAISLTRHQLSFRNSNLNRYDFQKYNLNEALVIQPEILILKNTL